MKIEIVCGQLRNLPEDGIEREFNQIGSSLFRFAGDERKTVFYKMVSTNRASIVSDEHDYYKVTNLQIEVPDNAKVVIVKGSKRISF